MTNTNSKPITILLAEDDEDDYLLISETLEEYRLQNRVEWVKDGEELLDYLKRRHGYADPAVSPRPSLILLDLNMPRKDGREALREIKADPKLRSIPVVILTTSSADEDIVRSYDLGANSYIRKPIRFHDFVEEVRGIGHYWFEIVGLPAVGEEQ
ncbi:MAG: response regulator [Desulfurivibrio sp.]|nr:response regulator [Desulfurivibrio sp.]